MRAGVLVFLGLVLTGDASAEVRVFNLPLGGRLERPLLRCKFTAVSEVDHCSADRVIRPAASNLIASVHLRYEDSPSWMDHDPAKVHFGDKGQIDSIAVKVKAEESESASRSISTRFGRPTSSEVQGTFAMVRWDLPELQITLGCIGSYCRAEFLSPSAAAERARRASAAPKRAQTP